MKFSSAVVGLGNIGQGYDYDSNDDSRILTHASGFFYHPGYTLIAGVDPDPGARARFEKKFQQPAFPALGDLFRHATPEVLSIGVPTELHVPVFAEAMAHSTKAILCEKPLAPTLAEGRRLQELTASTNCVVLVNYMRRFEPGVLELKKRIEQNEFGEIYKGVMWYAKGILNNGSHFIDLLSFFFGGVNEIVLLDPGRYPGQRDPEPDLNIRFGDVSIYFLAGRNENFSIQELELMGPGGSIKYSRGGEEIIVKKTHPSPLFPAYTILEDAGQKITTDLHHYQLHVLEALYKTLVSGVSLNSTVSSAFETMKVVENIFDLVKR